MKFWFSIVILSWLHMSGATAQETDRLQLSELGGHLLGQIIACGGHEKFAYVDRKVREKSWGGTLNPGPIIASYMNAKRAAINAQRTNQSGTTCDDVKVRFEDFVKELSEAPAG